MRPVPNARQVQCNFGPANAVSDLEMLPKAYSTSTWREKGGSVLPCICNGIAQLELEIWQILVTWSLYCFLPPGRVSGTPFCHQVHFRWQEQWNCPRPKQCHTCWAFWTSRIKGAIINFSRIITLIDASYTVIRQPPKKQRKLGTKFPSHQYLSTPYT